MITKKDLDKIKTDTLSGKYLDNSRTGMRIVVGMATCGIAAGAKPLYEFLAESAKGMDKVLVEMTGCIGTCRLEPMIEVYEGLKRTTYVRMTPEKCQRVLDEHIKGGKVIKEYTVGAADNEEAASIADISYFKAQKRVVLANCGTINPEDINEYIACGGYQALSKAMTTMTRMDVVDTMLDSGLRGRGGAGFPTGLKWKLTMDDADQKYVVCNADEGDPGAFMNRSVLEGDPHAVLEGMAIAGYTLGATIGYIYIRAEYPLAVERLKIAIAQAEGKGLLGKNMLGTGVDFSIELRLGAGAFVCGEETALLASIEGKRGEPRPKPPYPSQKGVFGKPTVINNVGTFANVPRIIAEGADWFKSMGTEKSPGTKVFALGGKISNPGLVEVPMGTTLRKIIYDMGGGIPDGKKFKAAQTGGPSGGCIPIEHIDTPIDYDSLIEIGTMMGSGGLIIMDEDNCMVDIARFFLDFTVDESCGKCVPCRIGTKRMLEILERITTSKGRRSDIPLLKELGANIKRTALCGLGQTAPNPVLSTLKYFEDEYRAHIEKHKCPAGSCKAMITYYVDADKCAGCGLCKRHCPVDAIIGDRKQPHTIDKSICIKCGACMNDCRPGAIYKR